MLFGKNRIDFLGLDNPEKIKGAEYTHIWLEEATDFDLEDVRQLRLRLGRNKANENARYIFTFNPIDAQHWTWTDLVQVEKPGRVVRLSTVPGQHPQPLAGVDRRPPCSRRAGRELLPHLRARRTRHPAERHLHELSGRRLSGPVSGLRRHRLRLQQRDRHHRHQTALGPLAGLGDPLPVPHDQHRPDCLAQGPRRHLVYLRRHPSLRRTSAEPNRIEEIRRAGFNARPADKSVKDGIDFCKAQALEVHSSAANLIREIRTYKYREDRSGRVYDEPVKFNDHAMDAMRYAAYSHFGQRRDVSIPKEWLSFGGAR